MLQMGSGLNFYKTLCEHVSSTILCVSGRTNIIFMKIIVWLDRQYRENWSGLEKSCLIDRECSPAMLYLASAPVHYSRTTDHIALAMRAPAVGVATTV